MGSSKNFYKDLKSIQTLQQTLIENHFTKVPDDWYVVISDVKNSTDAIKNGKYKEVNLVGALSIIGILNLDNSLDIPFVFGGDGSFLLIPDEILHPSKQVLLSVQKTALESFNLELRVGIIPVSKIKKKQLLIAKYQVAEQYEQVVVKGGALEHCDMLLKQSNTFHITESIDKDFEIDINGLECRWEAIPSPKDETLSILIKCIDEKTYPDLLLQLDDIIGKNTSRQPVDEKNLSLSFSNNDLDKEIGIYTSNIFVKNLLRLKLKFINLLGKFLMSFNIGKWNTYKKRVATSTDTEKFDDMIRMVVSTEYKQTQALEKFLEDLYLKKELVYGIHKADSSLMTCLVFQRHGKHIHFVDGSNGGYALASKELKKRLEEL